MDNKLEYRNELEEMILSVMLNDSSSLDLLAGKLNSKDFSVNNWSLFCKILESKETPEILMLELSKEFGYKSIHALKYKLAQPSLEYLLMNNIVERLKDVSLSLQVSTFLEKRLKDAQCDYNGLDTLENLSGEIQDLIQTTENFKLDKSFTQKLPEILESYENKILSKGDEGINIKSIPSFNSATNGLLPSNLVTIGGFTGQGKTFLALNLILDLAKQGIAVGLISLEQSEAEITDRLIGLLTGISSYKLRNPKKLNQEELEKISFPNLSKNNLPIFVNDRPLTETEIKSKIKYWRDRFNVKVVCVDYLGLVQSRTKFTSREREMTYYSEFLKLTAKELNIIIIILTQLNRQGKEKPTIDNLAESIGLARDSDFLFTIFKPLDAGVKSDENNKIKFDESYFILRCEKNRHNKAKKQILLKMKDSGEFIEIGTEYIECNYQTTNKRNK